MKKVSKAFAGLFLASFLLMLSTGCVEHNYYHRYHHHTRGWYDRHHTPPPAGVEFDIHN